MINWFQIKWSTVTVYNTCNNCDTIYHHSWNKLYVLYFVFTNNYSYAVSFRKFSSKDTFHSCRSMFKTWGNSPWSLLNYIWPSQRLELEYFTIFSHNWRAHSRYNAWLFGGLCAIWNKGVTKIYLFRENFNYFFYQQPHSIIPFLRTWCYK